MLNAVATGVALALAAPALVRAQDTAADRGAWASQAISLTMAYYEAQRSGSKPADADATYPTVWSWKQEAYTDMCSEAVSNSTGAAPNATDSMLGTYGGYFEAGNAVLATGTMAFTAVQRMMGAVEFMPYLESTTASNAVGDPAGCLAGSHSEAPLKEMVLREMRFSGRSLAALVTKSEPDNFEMIVGVGDTSTYRDDAPLPSWLAPEGDQQKCYVADEDNPAADIAAQLAAGLAYCAKVAREHGGTPQDQTDAAEWEAKAIAALAYADRMIAEFTVEGSTCTQSSTAKNCVGSTCTEIDPDDGSETEGTCDLYPNGKPATEQMFVANAALWACTGNPDYRVAADNWYQDSDDFAPSWNNVQPQGLMIMAAAPDSDAGGNSQQFYREKLAARAAQWATCSNDGEGAYGDGKAYCKKTPDGSAYPLDVPWGNMGAITNGLCITAIAEKYSVDPDNSERNRCFMQRQLGYMFNHKCATCTEPDDSNDTKDFINPDCNSCDTSDSAGFSYMVGMGSHYPTRLHSRDAAYPNFDEEYLPDGNLLCGALVAGPYAHGSSGVDGRAENGTDLFTNNRDLWFEAEPALDYSASMICALAGYASLQGPIANCAVRTPMTGRGPLGPAGGAGQIMSNGEPAPAANATAPPPPPPAANMTANATATPPPPPPASNATANATATPPPPPPTPAANTTANATATPPPPPPASNATANATATPPPPPPMADSGSCGGNMEPICEGADMDGREFECDYGYEQDKGMCIPFIPRSERMPFPEEMRTACGKGGEPVCSGDMMNGRQFECDFGWIGDNGICIPYAEFEAKNPTN